MGQIRSRENDPQGAPNLRRLRELKGWTQTELAARAGLGLAYINQLEAGLKTNPTIKAVDKLALALGVARSVVIDGRLSDAQLLIEVSQGALREALAAGISHPKFSRYVVTDLAPVSVEGWEQLGRTLEIADRPAKRGRRARLSRSKDSERQA